MSNLSYVLSLVCLGIVRVCSVLLIASLGIKVAEIHVSFQDAFVCPDSHPHIFAQALRVAEGHWCLYPCDSRGHAYQGRFSLMSSHHSNRQAVGGYLCKLSGLGYLCSLSGQNGQMYPGDSCTNPCRIISFFRLNPLPPSDLAQPATGQ